MLAPVEAVPYGEKSPALTPVTFESKTMSKSTDEVLLGLESGKVIVLTKGGVIS